MTLTFTHKNGLELPGTILSMRIGNFHYRGKSAKLNCFMQPHYQMLRETDHQSKEILRQYKNKDIPVPHTELVREEPLDWEKESVSASPVGSIAYNLGQFFDCCPVGQRPQKLSACRNLPIEIAGKVTDNINIGVRDGTIFSFYGAKSDGQLGKESPRGGGFIRVRAGAAFTNISLRLPEYEDLTHSTFYIEGRFDIIPLKVAYNYGVPPLFGQMDTFYDEVFFNNVFHVEILSPELEKREITRRKRTVGLGKDKDVEIVQRRKRRTIGSPI